MGIPGLLNELGPGERISLSKLAVTHFERTSRPLRIAVDISIWLFRVQAGRGGSNPEVRTLFFRLLKLLALPIHPLFVFDGDRKPPFKRGKELNKAHGANSSALSLRLSKRLIDLFSFPRHTAPGEAEAECAKLEEAGVVDAVMSDDVDAIMFGSRTTIMNYSRESSSGTDAATHVNLYRTKESQNGQERNISLDTSEMILFALLSGGDYLPSGVPKCGQKIAAQISRAGFGSDLLEAIKNEGNSETKLTEWRERLQHELHENESGFFQRKNKAIKIPDSFPDKEILFYYTRPVVSTHKEIEKLRNRLKWDQDIDIVELHRFVENGFGWNSTPGLKRFIKVFFAPLVSYRLRLKVPVYGQMKDTHLPEKIYRKRAIYANDGITELQFEFVPADVVGLDLKTETSEPLHQEIRHEYSMDQCLEVELDPEDQPSANNRRQPREYDPLQPAKLWIFESVAKVGAPEAVATWELEQERKEAALEEAKSKKAERKAAKARNKKPLESGMRQGELLRYANYTKPGTQLPQSDKQRSSPEAALRTASRISKPVSPVPNRKPSRSAETSTKHSPVKRNGLRLLSSPKIDKTVNPFTIAKSQAHTRNHKASNDSQFSNKTQDIFSAASREASKRGEFVDDEPFLTWSSPPPLPEMPNDPGRSEKVVAGTALEPITLSSSPVQASSISTVASAATVEDDPTKSQGTQGYSKHISDPQTPPGKPGVPSCSETVTAGMATEPIMISSSPIPPSSIPRVASMAPGDTPTTAEKHQEHHKHLADPQTPPVSSDLFTEDARFLTPPDILSPTPKPKLKGREPGPKREPMYPNS